MEQDKNKNVGKVIAVAVLARCASHQLKDVDALHKEVGDKCFHERETNIDNVSYKKATPSGWLFNIKVSSSLLHEYLNRCAHVSAVRGVYAVGELHAQTNFTHG